MLIEVSKLSASIASRVYPNKSLSGQLVQSGGTRDRGVNIVSVPTKSGRLATMSNVSQDKSFQVNLHLYWRFYWFICHIRYVKAIKIIMSSDN